MITVPGGPAPFRATRALVGQLVGQDELPLLVPRFISHANAVATVPSSLNDHREVKSQLRFANAAALIGGVRPLAWHLADTHPDGVDVEVRGELNRADAAVFAELARHLRLTVTWSPSASVEGLPVDEETAAVNADHEWIRGKFPAGADWDGLHARVGLRARVGRYISCGDSWTAVWLIEAALASKVPVTPNIADMIALAYQMAGQTEASETYRRIAVRASGPQGARAHTGLSMLYARQHPPALLDLAVAEDLLRTGWKMLEDCDASRLDLALNRNALAFVMMRTGRRADALALLGQALPLVDGDALATAIMTNNLGRLHGTADPVAAELHLRRAVELDPNFPEYRYDLGTLLANTGRLGDALDVALEGERLAVGTLDVLPALAGFLHSELGDPTAAAAAYARAHRISPTNPHHAVAAAREACAAGDGATGVQLLQRVDDADLSPEHRAEVELYRLWGGFLTGATTRQAARAALLDLAERYPESEILREHVEAQEPEPAA